MKAGSSSARSAPSLRAPWHTGVACALLCLAMLGQAWSATPIRGGPLVQFIDTNEHDDYADVTVQFSCTVHYIATSPVDHGGSATITLRLGADCGNLLNAVPPEFPPIGGGTLLTNARLDSVVPGEVTLTLTWGRELDFVMAPTASGSGLRVRLIGTHVRKAGVYLTQPEDAGSYAVNLESALRPFDHAAVEAAASSFATQAYVSETDLEDQHWYRLRVGPFASEQEAQRVLQAAQSVYPRAWLAINDEQTDLTVVERAGVVTAPALTGVDPPLSDEVRAQLMHDGRQALNDHRYPEAVDLLTRLVRQPEYPARADAQELLGLVRERAGQLAQAKAECEEYLRQYPDRPGAVRVRARLQSLIAASLAPKSTGDATATASNRWSMAGSASITYQYGTDQSIASGVTTTTTSASAGLVYADLLLRERGDRYDFTARVDAGYTQNLVTTFGGSQDRTTAAYVELTDRALGWTGRVGRQSLAVEGNIGLFDGVYFGYQINPKVSISAAAGLPAYSVYSAFSTAQTFGTVSAEWDPNPSWAVDGYLFNEMDSGFVDRRSVGLQTRYTRAGSTAVVLIDYDVNLQQLNSATLIGNARVGPSWVLGFDADYRRSPLLELNDALVGQSAPDLNALAMEFTPSQIKQLALDRTATSDTFVVSASRAVGERWQFMASVSALQLGSTPASGGVEAIESMGLDKSVSLQLSGLSLVQASDLHIFGVRFDDSPQMRSETLSWDARFVVHGAWRLGPRLSVEELTDQFLGGRRFMYLPELRGDWTGRRSIFELTAGYQLQMQQQTVQPLSLTGVTQSATVQQRSLYVSASYRLRF
jgi:tetratricopeptide (TPR) repeat protein